MVAQIDLHSPEFLANPYPFYRHLRATSPIYWAGDQVGWLITRHADISAMIHDPRLASGPLTTALYQDLPPEAVEAAAPFRATMEHNMIWQDPPDHTRLRGLVSKAFTPRMVEALRPKTQAVADDLLDRVQGAERMDVIQDYAYPLPALVMMDMLGLPTEDLDQLKAWSDDGVDFFANARYATEPLELATRAGESFRAITEYFADVVARRRRAPEDDLISAMIAIEQAGDSLSEQEMLATCVLLLAAGHETTANLIGNGVLALLRHPSQLQLLRDDPSLLAQATEELLRYDTPIQFIRRVATADVEIANATIRPGQVVMLLLGAANRDPDVFANPEQLDVTRQPRPHSLFFGLGHHFCLGAHLARLEARLAFATLLRRLPRLALASEALEWNPNPIFHGLRALPVTF